MLHIYTLIKNYQKEILRNTVQLFKKAKKKKKKKQQQKKKNSTLKTKTLMKEIQDDTNRKIYHTHGLEE